MVGALETVIYDESIASTLDDWETSTLQYTAARSYSRDAGDVAFEFETPQPSVSMTVNHCGSSWGCKFCSNSARGIC